MFDPRQATVIIIDDDAAQRASLELLLATADYRCRCYACAEDYLDQAQPQTPSCLLLDMHLPGMSGIELQQRLGGRRPCLPVIFLSGDANAEDIKRADAAGAVDFLRKPFEACRLLDSIELGLKRSLHLAD
ncbi:MAG: response regulator [Salinisphaera sp.]|jgi:two-component system response regulator FixJ|nr:response regulator [Salinisphaera sp.]